MTEDSKPEESAVLKSDSLKDFKLTRILFNNAAKRTIGLLGTFPESETAQAIIIVEKVEFAEENFTDCDGVTQHIKLETMEINDIYGKYLGDTDPKFNSKFCLFFFPPNCVDS